MECPLNVDNLEFLNCTLERAKLIQPFCRILGRNIDLIPTRRCFGCRQAAEEIGDPRGDIRAKTRSNPVAFRIGGTAGLRLYESRALETGGERPEDVDSALILRIEEFQDHGAAWPEAFQTAECLCH